VQLLVLCATPPLVLPTLLPLVVAPVLLLRNQPNVSQSCPCLPPWTATPPCQLSASPVQRVQWLVPLLPTPVPLAWLCLCPPRALRTLPPCVAWVVAPLQPWTAPAAQQLLSWRRSGRPSMPPTGSACRSWMVRAPSFLGPGFLPVPLCSPLSSPHPTPHTTHRRAQDAGQSLW
jgi:hypothetical protein